MNRRRFMATTAAVATAAATGAGTASAATSGLKFGDGAPTPNPTITGPVTVETHDRDRMSSVLEYIDDNDEVATLAEFGGQLAEAEDEDEPHNPVTLRADRIDAADFYRFPRDATYTDSDDEEQDLNALERPSDWSTSGSIVVEETEAASGGPALRFAGDGLADGDTGTATWDFSEHAVEDGALRKYIQFGVNVTALPSGSSATLRFVDSEASNSVEVTVDPSADEGAEDVIATSTTTGRVYQEQIGELVGDLERIDTVELDVADGDAELEVFALNVERSSRWQLGTEEVKNDDDELETETVYETFDTYSVTGIDTLGEVFSEATIAQVEVDAAFTSSGIDEELVEYEFEDLDHPSYARQLRLVVNRELPTAYELDYGTLDMVDTAELWPEQYATLEVAKNHSETVELEDAKDVDMVDRSDAPGDRGEDFELASSLSPGSTQVAYYVLRMDKSTEKEMMASSGGPGRVGASGGGGWFGGARGMLAGLAVGAVGFFAMLRSRILG